MLSGLAKKSIFPEVVIIHPIPQPVDVTSWEGAWISWDNFVEEGRARKLGRTVDGEIEWNRLGFDHPLWILFSSGTTGRPKYASFVCISKYLTIPKANSSPSGWYAFAGEERVCYL